MVIHRFIYAAITAVLSIAVPATGAGIWSPPPAFAAPPGAADASAQTLVRVALAQGLSSGTVGTEMPARLRPDGGDGNSEVAAGGVIQFTAGAGLIQVEVDGRVIGSAPGPLRLTPAAGEQIFSFGNRRYRGELEITLGPDGGLQFVNQLPLEQYLRGVVAKEMPAGWPAEALKAQAVAARTYALKQVVAAPNASGFHLTANTGAQVYFGVSGETPNTDLAVAATAGQVITYAGELITAFYHAASGGHTEDNEVVYVAGRPLPYLRGVADYDEAHSAYSWHVTRTAAEVAAALWASPLALDLGEIYDITPTGQQGSGGRWSNWLIRGSRGERAITGEQLRSALMLSSSPRAMTTTAAAAGASGTAAGQKRELPLFSTVSVLGDQGRSRSVPFERVAAVGAGTAPITLRTPWVVAAGTFRGIAATTFTFSGGGYGHGVGMSQWGARAMAELGYTYEEILAHYYTGIAVAVWPVRIGGR